MALLRSRLNQSLKRLAFSAEFEIEALSLCGVSVGMFV